MLFKICNPASDAEFEKCVDEIKNAYWPESDIKTGYEKPFKKYSKKVKFWKKDALWKHIGDSKLFVVHTSKPFVVHTSKPFVMNTSNPGLKFPFISNFHNLFKKRISNISELPDGEDLNPENASRLEKPASRAKGQKFKAPLMFYSKNAGNYNHFVNVVMATARLIHFFSDEEGKVKIEKIIFCNPRFRLSDSLTESRNELIKYLNYKKEKDMRTIKLMLAAFYHDIGKTVVDHRHGMEGAVIINEHNTEAWYRLHEIYKKSLPGSSTQFDRDDMLNLSDMVRYHDLFGTVSTGEAGYINYSQLINSIKNFGFRDTHNDKWNSRRFFDLWLLNVADIIVSIGPDKLELQKEWLKEEKSKKIIQDFFNYLESPKQPKGKTKIYQPTSKSERLLHDLIVGLEIIEHMNKAVHSDDTHHLQAITLNQAANHCVDRIQRLIVEILDQSIPQGRDLKNKTYKEYHDIYGGKVDNFFFNKNNEKYFTQRFSEIQIRTVVINSINSVANFQEFVDRMAWIGNMDYALGFFVRICNYAVKTILKEMKSNSNYTGWIHSNPLPHWGDKIINDQQSYFFLINFTSVVVHLIAHLLFRDDFPKTMRNFEFKDASERLSDRKLEQLLALKGPYKFDQSVHMILQSIFTY